MGFALAATLLALAAPVLPHPPVPRPNVAGPVALATGDSMMQVIQSTLKGRLEALGLPTVIDSRLGTGVTRPELLDWVAYATVQAVELRPEATIVFLGPNDVMPFSRRVPCCGEPWVAEYARRASRMLGAWLRGGAGRVYWLALPAPRDPELARVLRAVNRAVRRAVAGAPPGARVLDLVAVFTPGGRFRRDMTRGGERVHVRMADGVHLTRAGAEIATGVVVEALRADGVLAHR